MLNLRYNNTMNAISEHHILSFCCSFSPFRPCPWIGELFRFWKQPTLTAEILTGIILGKTIFGRFFPSLHAYVFPAESMQHNMLETVAWLGLLFFLLEAGLKMDFSSAWRHRGKALTIAIIDIVVPMTISFGFCYILPAHYLVDPQQRLSFSLFMATVMTISAMPIAVRVLNDLNVAKTDLGFLIMSALSVNEIIGWMLFTLLLGIFIQTGFCFMNVILVFILGILLPVFA